jgi:hypothetical protein
LLCGPYAASHVRRLVVAAAAVDAMYMFLVALAAPSQALIVVAAALSTIGWLMLIAIILVVVWYWVRLARSTKRLRYVQGQQALRDSLMTGLSLAWDSGRVSGGLAAPFDATSDPYAPAVLGFTLTVYGIMSVAGITASLSNAVRHADCVSMARPGNASVPALPAAGCELPAYPGVSHAAVIVIGLMLVGAAASNAAGALKSTLRQHVTNAKKRAARYVARHIWSMQLRHNASSGTVSRPSQRPASSESAGRMDSMASSFAIPPSMTAKVPTTETAVSGVMGVARDAAQAHLYRHESERLSPLQVQARMVALPKTSSMVIAMTSMGRSASAASVMKRVPSRGAHLSEPPDRLVASCVDRVDDMPLEEMPRRVTSAVREARRWRAVLARLESRVRTFLALIAVLSVLGIVDALMLSFMGNVAQVSFFIFRGIKALVRVYILLMATLAATSEATVQRFSRLACPCRRSTSRSQVSPGLSPTLPGLDA